jgi:hypothetical protein
MTIEPANQKIVQKQPLCACRALLQRKLKIETQLKIKKKYARRHNDKKASIELYLNQNLFM